MEFMGYRRPNGSVGVRNYIAVIPSVFCAGKTAERIAAQIPDCVALRHPVGCGQVGWDFELTARTLIAMGTHPNVAAVLVVGLGCERFRPEELYNGIKQSGKPVEMLVIQEEGGTEATIEKGRAIVRKFADYASGLKREPCPLSELTVALKCGGTDATSGLAANPAVGNMSDRIVAMGGSCILSELNELLGTEDMLAERAETPEVRNKIYKAISEIEETLRHGRDITLGEARNELISPGNFYGGVSSVVEKAMGGVHKGGTSPIVDVLDYAVPPGNDKHGLFLMDYESHDGEVVTGMLGCGAQITVFTTGRGNPTGHPIAPVIKVTGNTYTYQKMKGNFDYLADGIIAGRHTVEQEGKELLDMVLRVANGELTSAEKINGDELFCIARRHGCKRSDFVGQIACDKNCS